MRKTNQCPKCGNKHLIVIKDWFHHNAGGNITKTEPIFGPSARNTALITFYICSECGLVEEYLDQKELMKLKGK